jgi:hypothetical protein
MEKKAATTELQGVATMVAMVVGIVGEPAVAVAVVAAATLAAAMVVAMVAMVAEPAIALTLAAVAMVATDYGGDGGGDGA